VTAAVAALAGLRMPGVRHLDISWTACLMTGMELHYADGLATGRRRRPVGPFPTTAFPGGALPCRDGHVVPGSFREIDWEMQCLLYERPEMLEDERFRTRADRGRHIDEVWELIRDWYAARTKEEIFQLALDTPWTVGKVMTGREALEDRHLAERGFVGTVDAPAGPCRAPLRPFRMPGLPVADQRVRATGESAGDPSLTEPPAPVTRPRLDGVRLLEVTVAWAGPYVGNLLGALGMDVVKLEAVQPFEGYRVLRLHPDGDPDDLVHLRDDNRWFEASALHNAVNRNKRLLVVDLSQPDGRDAFLGLVASADAVLCNFTAGVLPKLRLGWDELSAVNPRLVLVRMPAFGTMGPYHEAAGYGTVVEGMGGFGSRFGYEDEGARISDLYWPDPVAGAHAAFAILAGLERRDRTGAGCEIDLAHMEVMWNQLGEGIVAASQRGRDVGRMGNREPGVARSGFVATADGRWVAVVGPAAIDDALGRADALDAAALCAAVAERGGRAEVVNEVLDAAADPRLVDRFEVVDHPMTGPVRQVRSPFVVDGTATTTRRPAPLFDQHTDELLRDRLGYDDERIARLRADGVVGGTLPDPASLGL
jgi:crotonobetainyl-CoA:carnitine CoA-transferase CaiB-like acyl-CoA transferase